MKAKSSNCHCRTGVLSSESRAHRFACPAVFPLPSIKQMRPLSLLLFSSSLPVCAEAELRLFLAACRDPNALCLTGDTAQVIARGLAFRFSDLHSIFFNAKSEQERAAAAHPARLERKLAVPDRVHKLFKNYRTHAGVLMLANGVVELIEGFFPIGANTGGPSSLLSTPRRYAEHMGPLSWPPPQTLPSRPPPPSAIDKLTHDFGVFDGPQPLHLDVEYDEVSRQGHAGLSLVGGGGWKQSRTDCRTSRPRRRPSTFLESGPWCKCRRPSFPTT